ncbi:MAG: hypothetical protein ACE37J_20725 [Pikeienuella sp.]|uniref:hypothetical protein n=1 Tax=Pikeienuella sp. TaxID=2831957 RepID=UPI00391C9836
MGRNTIQRILNDNGQRDLRPQARRSIIKTLATEWDISIDEQWFQISSTEKLTEALVSGTGGLKFPWIQRGESPFGLYRVFRYAFENTGRIAIEVLEIGMKDCVLKYRKAGDGKIGASHGSIARNPGGVICFLANKSSINSGYFRPKIYSLNYSTPGKYAKYHYGFSMSTTPTHYSPCVTSSVYEKIDSSEVAATESITQIIDRSEFAKSFAKSEEILSAIDNINDGSILKMDPESLNSKFI